MNNNARHILTNALEAVSSKVGAYQVPEIMNYAALPLIQAGYLGLQRGPLNAPGLWVYITAAGRAALR